MSCCRSFRPRALEFLKIQGLGPKSIALLFEHFRIATIDELERLCREQKLRDAAAHGREARRESAALHRAIPPAQRPLPAELRRKHGRRVDRIPAPDARRGCRSRPPAACGADAKRWAISICWSPVPTPRRRSKRFVAHPRVHEVLGRGENKASAKVGREGLQVDVRALPPESFGAAMQYFTGSKEHNVALRTRAVKMGLKLSEYGLFRVEDDARVAGETEEGVYEALGLAWIPPELRENCGEIEAPPKSGACRSWSSLAQIRGDLHMHTTETDGRATLEEMAEAARERGYEYIAITDHSKALAMANGLDEARAVAFASTRARDQPRRPRHPRLLRPRMRHPARRRDGSGRTTRWRSSTS